MTLPSLELDGATLEQLAVLTPLELEGAPLLDEGSLLAPSTENWVDYLEMSFTLNARKNSRQLKVSWGCLLKERVT